MRTVTGAVVACGFIAFGLSYSLLVPIWEASDEPAHYSRALRFARGLPPRPQTENYEAAQPPAFYWAAGLVLRAIAACDPGWIAAHRPPRVLGAAAPEGARGFERLARHEAFDGRPVFGWNRHNHRFLVGPHVLRWLNLCFGLIAVLLVLSVGRRLFPNDPEIAIVAATVFALNPQFLHVSASVSNDALANLAGSIALWAIVRVDSAPPAVVPACALATLLLFLPFATKLTALPISMIAATFVVWRGTAPNLGSPARVELLLAWILAGCIGAWLFGGHTLLPRISWASPDFASLLPETVLFLVRSYWGALGWMSVELPGAWIPLTAAMGIGLGASLRWTARPDAERSYPFASRISRVTFRVLWLVLLISAAAALKNAAATLQAQGRYLFPSAGAISLLAAAGWHLALPSRLASRLPVAALTILVGVNCAMLGARVLPVYFQPWLD